MDEYIENPELEDNDTLEENESGEQEAQEDPGQPTQEYKEAIDNAIKEAQGPEITVEDISIYREPPEEIETDPELSQKIGSGGTPRPYNYPSKPDKLMAKNIGALGSNASRLTKRESLEAKKRGLERYVDEECGREYKDPSAQSFMDNQRVLAEEMIEEIKATLEQLPTDDPTVEEARENECLEATIKRGGKKGFIEDMYSAGLNDGTDTKFGFEGLGKLMDKIDGVYSRMRIPPQYWPEYQKEPLRVIGPDEATKQIIEEDEYDKQLDYDMPDM